MFERACVVSSCLSLSCSLPLLPFPFHSLPVLCPAHHLQCRHRPRVKTTALLTGYEPKLLDNFNHSETSAMFFQNESGDIDTEPSYSCDAEVDDEIFGKAISSPLFIQEREEPANLRQAYHSHEESLLPAQSFSPHTRTERPVHEHSSYQKRKSSRIRILLEREKEQILAELRTKIQKHEFQADSDRRIIQELNGIIESQRREIDHTIASEQLRRDQLLLQEQLSQQNLLISKVFMRWRIEESSRITNR